MRRILLSCVTCLLAAASMAAPITGSFGIEAGSSALSGELVFDAGGGAVRGRTAIRAPADPVEAPRLVGGSPVQGTFDVEVALDGTFSGGPSGLLRGQARASGTFTDASGCAARVAGVGRLDGDVKMKSGLALAWSEWDDLGFDGCGLAPRQSFALEYPPFVFAATDEIPRRNPDAPPIPTARDEDAIARREARRDAGRRHRLASPGRVASGRVASGDTRTVTLDQDPGRRSDGSSGSRDGGRLVQETGYGSNTPPGPRGGELLVQDAGYGEHAPPGPAGHDVRAKARGHGTETLPVSRDSSPARGSYQGSDRADWRSILSGKWTSSTGKGYVLQDGDFHRNGYINMRLACRQDTSKKTISPVFHCDGDWYDSKGVIGGAYQGRLYLYLGKQWYLEGKSNYVSSPESWSAWSFGADESVEERARTRYQAPPVIQPSTDWRKILSGSWGSSTGKGYELDRGDFHRGGYINMRLSCEQDYSRKTITPVFTCSGDWYGSDGVAQGRYQGELYFLRGKKWYLEGKYNYYSSPDSWGTWNFGPIEE